jgi:hypothetical protein
VSEQPPEDPEPVRAGTGNEYPEHAMTAADAAPLIAKEVG